ncbi:hypothetical protein B0H13DRAFT_2046700 [Mycena leptocephala]|nr:hypothetical protein B0H13DRAFT_2046700 [Mycena leptocephala]
MSLLIDGLSTSRIDRSTGGTTLVSASFLRSSFPGRSSGPFAITLRTVDGRNLTVVLACQVSSRINVDVVLALDWKASLRECMLGLGQPVPTSFDPWALLSASGTFKVSTNHNLHLPIHAVPEIGALAPTHTHPCTSTNPTCRDIDLPIHNSTRCRSSCSDSHTALFEP